MSKPIVFISCGQYTPAEKQLGKQISEMVRKVTGLEPFFAEEVQDLVGLEVNILNKLRDCVGFITVIHPRGTIDRPDGSVITRASVWIEQEIAIAAYIQHVERRELPIIVFRHESVGLEGLRQLLHLNPIPFKNESEVLVDLAARLLPWRSLTPSGIQLQLKSDPQPPQDGHPIRSFAVILVNDTNQRIAQYNGEVHVPSGLLKHWSSNYQTEIRRGDPRTRFFRFSEEGGGVLNPHDQVHVHGDSYCTTCAIEDTRESSLIGGALVAEAVITAKVWIDGREYSVLKTVKQLSSGTA